jgi:hypothetical protein
LDIGAETPEEIAISIAGEIVAAKKGKAGIFEKGWGGSRYSELSELGLIRFYKILTEEELWWKNKKMCVAAETLRR